MVSISARSCPCQCSRFHFLTRSAPECVYQNFSKTRFQNVITVFGETMACDITIRKSTADISVSQALRTCCETQHHFQVVRRFVSTDSSLGLGRARGRIREGWG